MVVRKKGVYYGEDIILKIGRYNRKIVFNVRLMKGDLVPLRWHGGSLTWSMTRERLLFG